jgi:hypothetical protein
VKLRREKKQIYKVYSLKKTEKRKEERRKRRLGRFTDDFTN